MCPCPTLQVRRCRRPRMVGARMVRYSFSCMTLSFHYFTPVYPDAIQAWRPAPQGLVGSIVSILRALAAQHIQRHLRGELADAGAVADELAMQHLAAGRIRQGHVDRADRRLLAA
jgi:hypothetical protein